MRPVLLLVPIALLGCKAESAPQPTAGQPRPVQVAEVHLAPATKAHALTGVVRARHEADIAFRAGGRITARLVEVGQKVTAGQPMARIEEADLSLAARAAEADLSAAEAQSRQAASEAARSRSLRAAGHVSIAYDDQRVAAARSAAERAAAARAALDLARRRLDYALLRAPGNGVVTALLAEAGQVVAEGQPVFRLANPEERELVVQVPEAAVAGLAEARVAAQFWARPGLSLPTRLRELAPQAESLLRTYTARFSLPEAPDWITLGMTGTVLTEAPGETLATLPLSALHDRGAGPMVWRVAEGRVAAVPVEVVSLGEVAAVLRGPLAEGDQVVAIGPQLLEPASRVRIAGLRPAATLR